MSFNGMQRALLDLEELDETQLGDFCAEYEQIATEAREASSSKDEDVQVPSRPRESTN
ncbi:hypothetical protein AB4Y32_29370 [Paraburkholderia phymatum]|uniref:Uncharacterized protein n=1 Tax=Paraburkholderia phymatum TaxID=148447 RepID=A0ACC6U8P6_9BURK